MNIKFDIKRIIDGNIQVQGWVLPKNPSSDVTFKVYDSNHNVISTKITRLKRDDVADIYLKDAVKDFAHNFGFNIEFPFDDKYEGSYIVEISSEGKTYKEKVNKNIISDFNTKSRKNKELLLAYLNKNTFNRAFKFLFKEGPIQFLKKTKRKLKGINVDYDYGEWYTLTTPDDEYYEKQRKNQDFKIKPFFSIVIPVYDTSFNFLHLLFKSIVLQTYQNFEVVVADATDYDKSVNKPNEFFEKLLNGNHLGLDKYNFDFSKIRVINLGGNKGIAENTNVAISNSKGDYIVLCDHDDTLTYDALYENALAINENSEIELIYSDEDKVDTKDDAYFEPAFKSDFNLDMLLSVNYFCHLTTIKKSLLDEIYRIDNAYERNEFDGAQDYDLFLRLVNHIINKSYDNGKYDTSKIYHIKKVLYHWRCHKKSTSKNTDSKLYAFENGKKALKEFYKKTKIDFPKVDRIDDGFDLGIYRTIYSKDYDEPLISVIIPNKDHVEDLDKTINSVLAGAYKNLEFIICENNSTENSTFEYYKKLKLNNKIKVVEYKDSFNYSRINNFAAKYATGEYLLFLNNDVEMIDKDSIHEMYSFIRRSDVGAVGAKLLYKDNSYQHAGVIIGIGGIADHAFKNINKYEHTYMNRAEMVSDLNAVTAACLMTKKDIFEKINGFDENLVIAFNDIDLCLRIRELDKLIVYTPNSSFYHYESKSRGLEDTPEKVKRFNNEFAIFVKKWESQLQKIDCYYNPNLTLRNNNFSLRDLKHEKIGEPFPIPTEISNIMSNLK